MKSFRTFSRRKSDRIDALRLHHIANEFNRSFDNILIEFIDKEHDYFNGQIQRADTDSFDYAEQQKLFNDYLPTFQAELTEAFTQWFSWREGERPSLEEIKQEKQLSAEKEWSLMEDHTLEMSLAIERFSGRIKRASQHHWALFFKRATVLTADSSLTEFNCPFNPHKIGQIVFDALDKAPLNFKTKSILFRLFDEVASWPLSDFIIQQDRWLQQEGLLPNLSEDQVLLMQQPSSDGNAVRNLTFAMDNQAGAVAIDPAVLQNLLSSINQLQGQDEPAANDIEAVKAWSSEQASTVSQQFKGSDKSSTIKLVSMLFEYFFADDNLADEMKHLLARIQIPIIKAAILDRSFFDNSQHPARLLVNRMAHAAAAWLPTQSHENDLLLQGMHKIVQRLLNEFDQNIELFDELLQDFDALKHDYEAQREKHLAVIRKEEAKALAQIQSQDRAQLFLTLTLDEVELPDEIRQMLATDWYRLMRLISLRQPDSKNWRNSARIAKELVWSLQPSVALLESERFSLVVPKMLNGLEDGLRAIAKSDPFIHQLRTYINQTHEKALASAQEQKANAEFEAELAKLDAQMRDVEKMISGALPIPIDEPDVKQVPADINFYLAEVEALQEGYWFIDQRNKNNPERLCLSVILEQGAKYIFTDAEGKKQFERSAIGLAVALRDSVLTPLDSNELIERTLKNVVENSTIALEK